MQVDTSDDTPLTARNFCLKMGEPKLRISNLQLKHFNLNIIKVMCSFEGAFETKKMASKRLLHAIKFMDYKELTCGGARVVMVIVVGIGHDDTNSNPGRE